MADLDYSQTQFIAIVILLSIEMVLYLVTLIIMAYIVYWFLYRQQKYRIFFIVSFYVLSGALIVLRLALTIMVVIYTKQN